jgi:rRNA maturation endonuclease Nob1
MIGDALDEAGIGVGAREPQPVERVVMIRCTTCQTLNDDGSKFCQECGAKL